MNIGSKVYPYRYPNVKKGILPSSFLIKSFVFFGVIGSLLPLPVVPHSFRFYYLLLPAMIIYFMFIGIKGSTFRYIQISIPLLIYLTISASISLTFNGAEQAQENPMFRLGLLFCLFITTILIASYIDKDNVEYKFNLITLYLKGYFTTLIFGYIFFIGYNNGILTQAFIENFQVMFQEGYGLMRISPGSYPNEYGNVSSFVLSIITLLLMNKKRLKEEKTIFKNRLSSLYILAFGGLTLVALFLTTTRAAYISFGLSLVYLIFSQFNVYKIAKSVFSLSFFSVLLFWFVQNYIYDIMSILRTAYYSFFNEDASAYERFNAWDIGFDNFKDHLLFGLGFGTSGDLHNTYLQMLFEIGVVGVILFFLTFITYMVVHKNKKTVIETTNIKYEIFSKTKNLAILHVLWFATNNHNVNHHLTWFCVLLVLLHTYKVKKKGWKSRL